MTGLPVPGGAERGPAGDAAPFARIWEDPEDPESVTRMTFVPFLPDGRCLGVRGADGAVVLPYGEVRPGEDWMVDTAIRVLLETAGFRMQRIRPFGYQAAGRHVFVQVEGDRYEGRRAHTSVEWFTGTPAELAAAVTVPAWQAAVLDADRARREQSDESFFADTVRLLERAYLRTGSTAEQGSGFGGGPEQWRTHRRMVVAGLHKDGAFLDLGCANGLLMESVAVWAAEDGRTVQPYGVDLSAGLVAEARRRLPHWAERIAEGNALDWTPADGRRFDFVHVLADCVPAGRFPEVVRHARDRLVAPGGRLLVSVYQPAGATAPDAAARLAATGITVAGRASGEGPPGTATTAWCDA